MNQRTVPVNKLYTQERHRSWLVIEINKEDGWERIIGFENRETSRDVCRRQIF